MKVFRQLGCKKTLVTFDDKPMFIDSGVTSLGTLNKGVKQVYRVRLGDF